MNANKILVEVVPQGSTRAVFALRPKSIIPEKIAELVNLVDLRNLSAMLKKRFPKEETEFVRPTEFIREVEARERRVLR